MEPDKAGLDLERELTCSICTELLYQPLTLLDCLHTFCGACLKEWFAFQAANAERSRSPPAPGAAYTCPSCRAPVRDTKHNATVATLLDMFVTANPSKARTDAEKEEMARKYKPGDQVLPKTSARGRTARDRRADEADRRLLQEVREMSLRETGAAASGRGRESRSADYRSRASRDRSASNRSRRRERSAQRNATGESARRSAEQLQSREDRRRRRRSDPEQHQVEHQSSLRSLISSEDMTERDIEREIDDFARQIQEEGLLEGLDLDNIDLSRNDELSRRITEAYRRRQRERPRPESARRNHTAGNSSAPQQRSGESSQPHSRQGSSDHGSRASSQPRPHARSSSANRRSEDRSRPPPSMSANLEVRDQNRRARRRTASGGRRSTDPTGVPSADIRPAARSQTDLSIRTQASDPSASRPVVSEDQRSSSTPIVPVADPAAAELPGSSGPSNNHQSFASRALQENSPPPQDAIQVPSTIVSPSANHPEQPKRNSARVHQPTELAIVHSVITSPINHSPTTHGHQRTRSQLYPEPSICCSRCGKEHIEYELHYNCHICNDGRWNLCLDCYRAGKGCLYWFGFGYGAWSKWERAKQRDESMAPPHMLTASRYLPPTSTPGGADGRKTLTTDDPGQRLESGTFCANCFAWTNQCYWRCETCNEGDWGFCNDCVNQGKSCTHSLLPLTHDISQPPNNSPRARSPVRPSAAAILTGPLATSIGPFKPLTFNTRCDVCQDVIAPTSTRYHCYSCTSTLVKNATPGDYDICTSCYASLESRRRISAENGQSGWRRCLNGHRMVVIGFKEGKIGQWRYIENDLVGGHCLQTEHYDNPRRQQNIYTVGGRTFQADPQDSSEPQWSRLQKWSWERGDQKLERIVTKDVAAQAPREDSTASTLTQEFPPNGGVGSRARMRWSWFPKAEADDELLCPKGAEIQEIKDINGDWFFGTYMGAKGLFPAPYVQMLEDR